MPEIKLHPFDPIDPVLLAELRSQVEQVLGAKVTVAEDLAIPRNAFSRKREQFLSARFLEALNQLERSQDIVRLGITDVDLYAPSLNFVFGEADPAARVAVFSLVRLDPRAYGEPEDRERLLKRAVTEAIHELGHALGLKHCDRPDCAMWFSNSLAETDRKGARFCETCLGQLPVQTIDREYIEGETPKMIGRIASERAIPDKAQREPRRAPLKRTGSS